MTSHPLSAFIVRKKTKEHGLQKEMEGNLESPVVIVDDVITQDKSTLETVYKIVKQRREVVGVIAIVDREEGTNEEQQLRDRNIELFRIFRHSDLMDFINQQLKSSNAKTEAYQSV
jgi:orotate phosphoribosyltransferase